MEKRSLEFLEALSNTASPSGFEEPAIKIWDNYIKESHIPEVNITKDTYGSSIAILYKNSGPKVMLSGHIDEVGMMVKYINDDGFIYISSIGGIDATILPTHRVTIFGNNGQVPGIIGRKPFHLMENDEATPEIYELQIDIGAKNKEEALELVSVGNPIVIDTKFHVLGNNRVVGRGLDDKVGAWCVAEALIRLSKSENFKGTLFSVASIQEENGCYGAKMSSYKINPDIAIAIDVIFATDNQDLSKERYGDINLGYGPVISIGSVSHKNISNSLIKIAKDNNIPIQLSAQPKWSGTDADFIFNSREGIRTGVVSIPNRYMHTPIEMVQLEDLDNTVELLVKWCENYNLKSGE